jgi:hypothetical protein
MGLDNEQQALLTTVAQFTNPDARILWEDRPGNDSRWTALLPVLTGRSFLGGLDAEGAVEHAGYAHFTGQQLAGRPVQNWADVELEEFARKYNLGWVVCWTPEAQARFRAWEQAEAIATLSEKGQTGCLFALHRTHTYVLKGQARWVGADCRYIVLSDVVPEDGKVVLSLHYQAGMQVSPGRVRLEKEPDPRDPIPFVRLLVPDPVTRITLTWEGP